MFTKLVFIFYFRCMMNKLMVQYIWTIYVVRTVKSVVLIAIIIVNEACILRRKKLKIQFLKNSVYFKKYYIFSTPPFEIR